MSARRRHLLTLLAVVVLVVAPLFLYLGSDNVLSGSDSRAVEEAGRIDPDHEPWFEPVWSPPEPETEGLLFALQAALGAAVIGYVAGVIRTRSRLRSEHERASPGQFEEPERSS